MEPLTHDHFFNGHIVLYQPESGYRFSIDAVVLDHWKPAVLGVALNEVFIPILQKQFPEIVDFYLPPEGCSYRVAVVSMKKQYPGHAKRVMMGVWSFLRQFMYTKFVIVVDDDVNTRDWQDVIWAMTTRVDPVRDFTMVKNTPIDYLDFASPVSGLG